MTDATTEAPAASVNGSQPAGAAPAPEAPCADCATGTERAMGIVGLLFAIGLAAIGVDLLTGGAVSRMVTSLGGGSGAEEQ